LQSQFLMGEQNYNAGGWPGGMLRELCPAKLSEINEMKQAEHSINSS